MKKEKNIFDLQCVTVLIAAQLLGISKGLCYRMAKEGIIPTVRIGRRLVVPVEALHTLLADGKEARTCQDVSEKQPMATALSIGVRTVDGVPPSG
ncbi:MAG: helix-turn-helix domain-containing protein [Oscillospiraceae bacterium]|nr:helix-turn-helix domain-containing protein [Oscillospiraceae bacterium]